jgi:hypothetical protein
LTPTFLAMYVYCLCIYLLNMHCMLLLKWLYKMYWEHHGQISITCSNHLNIWIKSVSRNWALGYYQSIKRSSSLYEKDLLKFQKQLTLDKCISLQQSVLKIFKTSEFLKHNFCISRLTLIVPWLFKSQMKPKYSSESKIILRFVNDCLLNISLISSMCSY